MRKFCISDARSHDDIRFGGDAGQRFPGISCVDLLFSETRPFAHERQAVIPRHLLERRFADTAPRGASGKVLTVGKIEEKEKLVSALHPHHGNLYLKHPFAIGFHYLELMRIDIKCLYDLEK